jgi:transposase
MGQNFISADRGEVLLMPPCLADWLPEEHFVWTVLGAVDQMDRSGFFGAYRANGQGRAAYDPAVVLGLLLYAYASGISSSRQIERCCEVDVAFKVITAMRVPDHSTIAEFRRRYQDAIADVFVEVLALCAEAGLVKVGVIAIDGTKIRANASRDRNRSYVSIVEELLGEAERVDREEDDQHGQARGDELPAVLRSREQRRRALAEAKARLEAERRDQLDRGEAREFEAGVELVEVELRRAAQQGPSQLAA